MADVAENALDQILKILDESFEDDMFGYIGKLAVLATAIDAIALQNGEDPVETKKQLFTIGTAVEEQMKQEMNISRRKL